MIYADKEEAKSLLSDKNQNNKISNNQASFDSKANKNKDYTKIYNDAKYSDKLIKLISDVKLFCIFILSCCVELYIPQECR
jgi:hypothetical protein